MENPYQAPQDLLASRTRSPGWADWVPFVAVCLMLQGLLEGLLGVMMVFAAIVMPLASAADPSFPLGDSVWLLFGIYMVMGVGLLTAGGIKLWAGWRNYRYRGRTLGIVALASCIPTILTGFCAPTGIALAVFGLIVYLDAESSRGFDLADEGHSPEQIRALVGT